MNEESKYYDQYYAFVLNKVSPTDHRLESVFRIIADLTDRRGLKHEFRRIDSDIQDEIIETWVECIKL